MNRQRRARGDIAWLAAVLLASGCSPYRPASPRPRSISPDHLVLLAEQRRQPLPVEIQGDNLLGGLQVDLRRGEIALASEVLVLLGQTVLEQVRADFSSGPARLRALVPTGIPPGSHDLVLRLSDGSQGVLADAFTVREIVGLELAATPASPLAGDPVTVSVRVLDDAGEEVPASSPEDVQFRLLQGTGSLRQPRLVGSRVEVVYDTASRPEGALLEASEQLSGRRLTGRAVIDSRAGAVAGVVLEPSWQEAEVSTAALLNAWLVDERGNPVPLLDPADLELTVESGTGSIESLRLEQGRLVCQYRAAPTVELARLQARELLTGQGYAASAEVDGRPGPPARLRAAADPAAPRVAEPVTLSAWLEDAFGNQVDLERADEVLFTRLQGRGLLSAAVLFGGRSLVIYSTYRLVETALIQAEISQRQLEPVQLAVTSRGGEPSGVRLEPARAQVGAGQTLQLRASLTDGFGNFTPTDDAAAISIAMLQGPGSLSDAPRLVDGAVVVDFAAPNAVGSRAVVEATEQVTGAGGQATAELDIVAGPVASFELEPLTTQVAAGIPFAVELRARDAFGNLASGFTGFVHLEDSTGTLTPALSGLFASGQRTENLTIWQAGLGVIVRAWDDDGHAGATPPLTVSAAEVAGFVIEPVVDQQAGQPFVVEISAIDQHGNLAQAFSGQVLLADTSGTLVPGLSDSFTAGQLQQQVVITQVGDTRILLDDGAGHRSESNTFLVTAAAPHRLVFTTPPRVVLPDWPSALLQVQVQDRFGNPAVLGADATLLLTSDSPTGAFDSDPAGAFDGTVQQLSLPVGRDAADFYYRDPTPGDFQIGVADAAALLQPASQALRVSAAGLPARLALVVVPAQATAGEVCGPLRAQLQDGGGNPVPAPGDLVVALPSDRPGGAFATSPAGPFDGSITTVLLPAGSSDAEFYYLDSLAGPATIGVSAASLFGDSATLLVGAGPVAGFTIATIANQVAGVPFGVQLSARDAFGNLAESFSGTVTMSDLTGTLAPVTSAPFQQGRLTASLSITRAVAADNLRVDDGAGHLAQSNDFAVWAGALERFTVVPLGWQHRAGESFTVSLEAQDAFGNRVESFSGSVDLGDSTGTLSPAQSAPFTAGQLQQAVTITAASAGTVIQASDGQGHQGQSAPVTITAAELQHFTFAPLPDQVGQGAAFRLQVMARDQYQNQVTDFTGTVLLADQTGTLQPASAGPFTGGQVEQFVTVGQLLQDDYIVADDGAGHQGFSELFDVVPAQPASLGAQLEFLPAAVVEGEPARLLLTVSNSGDFAALQVQPQGLGFTGDGSAQLLAEPQPPWPDIPARSSISFTWQLATGLGSSGVLQATVRAQGSDSQGGGTIYSNSSTASLPISAASCLLNPLYADAGADRQVSCATPTRLGGNPTAAGGVPAYSYAWQPPDDLDSPTGAEPVAVPWRSRLYLLEVGDQAGCRARDLVAVDLLGGPQAHIQASSRYICRDDRIYFDAANSSGQAPLSFSWDSGAGDQDQGIQVNFEYQDRGWYRVRLTVTDAAGCSDQAVMEVGVADKADPAGPVTFPASGLEAPANGSSTLVIESDELHQCNGNRLPAGKLFHLLATRGTLLTADADNADGIQVASDALGRIAFTLQADRHGGQGRVLVRTVRPEGGAQGSVACSFTGSTSLPRVVEFAPSGALAVSPARVAVRFDKPLNAATALAGISLVDAGGQAQAGQSTLSPDGRLLTFVPEQVLDVTGRVFTVRLASTITDSWGNPLDGDFDGQADGAGDDFQWSFGAVADSTPPQLSCRGESEDPFSPDGDGWRDTTDIQADISDDQRLALWLVNVYDASGWPVVTLAAPLGGTSATAGLEWDGHDAAGLLVSNGDYSYNVFAYDAAGNVSSSCKGTIRVEAVIDSSQFTP